MIAKMDRSEILRIAATILTISGLLALINPFTENYILGFGLISLMFGGTAVPFHLYARARNKQNVGFYMAAGALCGGAVGIIYSIVRSSMTGEGAVSTIGIIMLGNGGLLLGGLCALLFYIVVVNKKQSSKQDVSQQDSKKLSLQMFLNILGFIFGTLITNKLIGIVYPILLEREQDGSMLMSVYSGFVTFFPILFLLIHITLIKLLFKGSQLALVFVLFEIVVLIVNALYVLPIDINLIISVLVILLSVCGLYMLWRVRLYSMTASQNKVLKMAMILVAVAVTVHVMLAAVSVISNARFNQMRENSSAWHAGFQPQKNEESEDEADKSCQILEQHLASQSGASFEDMIQLLNKDMEAANLHYSTTSNIDVSRALYYFKASGTHAVDAPKIEEELIDYVMKGKGLHEYAVWKAKYGQFFESSYDIYYTPPKKFVLDGPYVTVKNSFVVVSVPLRDPMYMARFWQTKELQTPPPYLKKFMYARKLSFDHAELWDDVNLSYVYDLNGFRQHILLADTDYFHVGLRYLARREADNSISDMNVQRISCSYPYRGEIYERPAGVNPGYPSYPSIKECHSWRPSIYCPGLDKPIRHTTNTCRQLGKPLPSCPF